MLFYFIFGMIQLLNLSLLFFNSSVIYYIIDTGLLFMIILSLFKNKWKIFKNLLILSIIHSIFYLYWINDFNNIIIFLNYTGNVIWHILLGLSGYELYTKNYFEKLYLLRLNPEVLMV